MVTSGGGVPYGRVNFGWIGESWVLFSKQAGVWILAVLIFGILQIAAWAVVFLIFMPGVFSLSALSGASKASDFLAQSSTLGIEFVGFVASAVVGAFFYGGLFRMANKVVRGDQIEVGDLFSGGPVIMPMLGYSFLFGLTSNLGMRMCIIPGLIVGALWWPGHALIADGETFASSFQRSMNGVARDFLNAALFTLVWGLILLATTLVTCGLALLVTMPMSYVIASLMCRDMVGPLGAFPPGYGAYYPTQSAPGVWPPPPNSPGPGAPPGQNPYGPPPATGQWPPYSPPPAGPEPFGPVPPASQAPPSAPPDQAPPPEPPPGLP